MLLSIQLPLVLHFFTFLSMSLVDENPNAKLGTAPQSQICNNPWIPKYLYSSTSNFFRCVCSVSLWCCS
ncbi:hypothetical protein PGT21_008960 [Puccinia graminis f. sp. tritici]|uniref:Secreted protein n=1 Tax=Puccinia graminis f. sp. tritici TaxID=56615 RepID=A0A5B0S1R6_PUCGR|nr:hypothetical protein PGT21_008960 [Puccinia graminis f. sp. tritici]KAA1131439.1 hypothetical protein PGTUg99_014719 [Puccinia graminis f. sp. tritici]